MLFKKVAALLLASASVVFAQDSSDLGKEDARLNQLYKQRVAQLVGETESVTALRLDERRWIRLRDKKCGKETACLAEETRTRADYLADLVAKNSTTENSAVASGATAAIIPEDLRGIWTISKELKTPGVGCWGQEQVNALLGTTIDYRSDRFIWKNHEMRSQKVNTSTVEAQQFVQDNSGSGGTVDFKMLGIDAPSVKQIQIDHPDVAVYDEAASCCAVAPGEIVMVKKPNALVISICGVFYEATRAK